MSKWSVEFLPEAAEDRRKLDGSVRRIVDKAIDKVSTNPLPVQEGGYGKPLSNRFGSDLSGLLKIKLRKTGIRIVYKLIRTEEEMLVVVIGLRADEEVYKTAHHRVLRNSL